MFFFFQAEDGIRDAQESRGLGDVYKRQVVNDKGIFASDKIKARESGEFPVLGPEELDYMDVCLLYTSDAADDLLCVDLGGRRIIKKKRQKTSSWDKQIQQDII